MKKPAPVKGQVVVFSKKRESLFGLEAGVSHIACLYEGSVHFHRLFRSHGDMSLAQCHVIKECLLVIGVNAILNDGVSTLDGV